MHFVTPNTGPQATTLVVVLIFGGVVGIGMYAWYGLALSRLFPKLGSGASKGWIPVVNDAEIFTLGGVPAWSVVLYFIPVVNVYALILRIQATSRINAAFGRGGGMTSLAVILPPLWATILASSQPLSIAGRIAPTLATTLAPTATPPPRGPSAVEHHGPLSPYLSLGLGQEAPAVPALYALSPDDAAGTQGAGDDGSNTIVVDRRPKTPWRLGIDGVGEFPLMGPHVLLGRKPIGTIGVQALSIPDATRTVSKMHARLDRVGDEWVITDLNSTNGVIVIAEDGTERLLAVGESSPVPFSFILGKLAMSISTEEPAA